ncbi:MAG TPA: hypothetical protein VK155_19495 [Bacteroidales bacterium]|jgi:hypothetical protein|nr:hypothetical protein [Bacteroidales bacterium]
MKKILFISVLILFSGIMSAQAFQKGNLIGTHVIELKLQPGVTQDQFIQFFKSKYGPELEKNTGWKAYLVKGVRGENPNSLGLIYVINSEKDRDRFYNPDGTQSDAGKEMMKKSQGIIDEMSKYATFNTKYTDWIVL